MVYSLPLFVIVFAPIVFVSYPPPIFTQAMDDTANSFLSQETAVITGFVTQCERHGLHDIKHEVGLD